MPAWEATGKVKILNDKTQPMRVPYVKTHRANCLDLGIITPGLEKTVKKWTLDKTQAWSPASAIWTGEIKKSIGEENLQTTKL